MVVTCESYKALIKYNTIYGNNNSSATIGTILSLYSIKTDNKLNYKNLIVDTQII